MLQNFVVVVAAAAAAAVAAAVVVVVAYLRPGLTWPDGMRSMVDDNTSAPVQANNLAQPLN
jgi:hypothetical protein